MDMRKISKTTLVTEQTSFFSCKALLLFSVRFDTNFEMLVFERIFCSLEVSNGQCLVPNYRGICRRLGNDSCHQSYG